MDFQFSDRIDPANSVTGIDGQDVFVLNQNNPVNLVNPV